MPRRDGRRDLVLVEVGDLRSIIASIAPVSWPTPTMWLTTALRLVLAGGDVGIVRGDGGGIAIWVDGVEPAFDDLTAGVLNARAQLVDPALERLVFRRSGCAASMTASATRSSVASSSASPSS